MNDRREETRSKITLRTGPEFGKILCLVFQNDPLEINY